MTNRYISTLLILCSLTLACFPAVAQDSEEQQQAIVGAMTAMDDFMLGFNARDPQAWAASLNYPHVRFASGTVTVWDSAEEFEKTRAFESLPRSGWDHSHWLTRDVILVSESKVHIATKFARFNSENETLATYESLYIITKVDGHWGTQARSSLAP